MPDYCLEAFGQEIGVNFQNNFLWMFNVGHVCANLAKKGQGFGCWIEDNGDVEIKIKATLIFVRTKPDLEPLGRFPFASNLGVVR